jgi:23S rRNA pseudouridine1911/1915/1917 synthase
MTLPLEILYDRGPCLVVNKPAALLTQGPPGVDSLELRVRRLYKEREGITGNIYLGVPHRLDRPVSGAIVFARHERAAKRLSRQFEERLVKKTYWAIVEGHVATAAGAWTDYLRKIPGEARAVVCDPSEDGAQWAALEYRLLKQFENASLLEIELGTGRTHQIRVQAGSRGHAIVGDRVYGATTDFGVPASDERERNIALHARQLRFRDPMIDEMVDAIAPLPCYWPASFWPPHDCPAS